MVQFSHPVKLLHSLKIFNKGLMMMMMMMRCLSWLRFPAKPRHLPYIYIYVYICIYIYIHIYLHKCIIRNARIARVNCGMFSARAVSRHRACSGLPVLAAWRGFSQHSLAGNALFFFPQSLQVSQEVLQPLYRLVVFLVFLFSFILQQNLRTVGDIPKVAAF